VPEYLKTRARSDTGNLRGHGVGADLKERARTFAETFFYLSEELM
jgi:hypothetical protein